MFSDTVTLFNLYNGVWYPTVLQGVEAQEVTGRTESKDGSKPADTCSLHIPECLMQDYHRPKAYTGDGYTIREGDIFVIGDICAADTVDEEAYETGYLTYLKDKYDGVYNINSISVYKTIPHIEVKAS